MTPQVAKVHYANHGSVLRHYESGRVASIVIPSGEALIVSIGTATAKIIVKCGLFGWLMPRTIAHKNLADWIPEYRTLQGVRKFAVEAMVLDGLVSLAARAKHAGELSFTWTVLRNPIEVAVEECGWGLNQQAETRTPQEQAPSNSGGRDPLKPLEPDADALRRFRQPPAKPCMTPFHPDDKLAKVVGDKALPRTELTKLLWVYIRKNGLQDPKDKNVVHADENLKAVFNGKEQVNISELTELRHGEIIT